MLIEFRFKNYRSFRDEAVLSMEAVGLASFKNCLIEHGNMKLLPGVAIYGKNGGGKSNVIRAFWLGVQFIRNAQRIQHEKAIVPEDEIDTEAAASEEMTQESAEAARAEAEEILAQAKAEAEEILAQAQAQAGQIREEAKKEGFNSGTIESERQLTEKKQELEQQHAQLVKQLEEDYEQRRNDMEPQIVEALLAVFTEVTHTVSEDNKEIVLHLINNVLKNVENSHSYSIKVSPDDYNFVLNNQGKIYCAMNNEVNLDIVQDMALKQNECMIETDSGVFNCSLDVELHNLIKQIKLLSCM